MTSALRKKVRVKPGGLIEISAPELAPGTLAEVIVLVEGPEAEGAREARLRELSALFEATQALPEAKRMTEEEIAAEIAAYRASRR